MHGSAAHTHHLFEINLVAVAIYFRAAFKFGVKTIRTEYNNWHRCVRACQRKLTNVHKRTDVGSVFSAFAKQTAAQRSYRGRFHM